MRAHIQELFRRYRHLTSPVLTKVQLEKGHRVRMFTFSNWRRYDSRCHGQWLDEFNKAKRGDERLRAVLERFGRLVDARRDNLRMRQIVNDALVRPILIFSTSPNTVLPIGLATPSPQPPHRHRRSIQTYSIQRSPPTTQSPAGSHLRHDP